MTARSAARRQGDQLRPDLRHVGVRARQAAQYRRNEAQQYVDTYFERYPGVKRYMEDTKQIARDQGYVETVFGRRLYLPDINARNANVRQYAERTAINAPMQGSAADIIKRAMIRVHAWLAGQGEQCRMIMQVHDELVFEVDAAKWIISATKSPA